MEIDGLDMAGELEKLSLQQSESDFSFRDAMKTHIVSENMILRRHRLSAVGRSG